MGQAYNATVWLQVQTGNSQKGQHMKYIPFGLILYYLVTENYLGAVVVTIVSILWLVKKG